MLLAMRPPQLPIPICIADEMPICNVSWTSVERMECYPTSLVMAAHVVTQPNDGDWLRNVATTSDEIQGEIAGADRDMLHIQ
jgi:hypothetical protein